RRAVLSSTELRACEEPPAGVEPAPRPYEGRVLAVDTTEARLGRSSADAEADRLPLACGCRLFALFESREERGERAGGGVADAAAGLEPGVRLGGGEGWELEVGDAASRAGDGRVEGADRLVRRDEHEHAQPLAEQPVGDVEEPRETLACTLLRVRRQELAGVLEDEEPPARFVVLVFVVLVEQDVEHVAGLSAEERLGIGDVVAGATLAPRPGERAHGVRLAGSRRPVPEDQTAAVPVAEAAGHQLRERHPDAARV